MDVKQVHLLHRDLAGGQWPLLRLDLSQEGRWHVEESGRDVECKEVPVDPLPTHRCLQQSLVLVHGHPEQGKALLVLGPPGQSEVMERQGVGLLW